MELFNTIQYVLLRSLAVGVIWYLSQKFIRPEGEWTDNQEKEAIQGAITSSIKSFVIGMILSMITGQK